MPFLLFIGLLLPVWTEHSTNAAKSGTLFDCRALLHIASFAERPAAPLSTEDIAALGRLVTPELLQKLPSQDKAPAEALITHAVSRNPVSRFSVRGRFLSSIVLKGWNKRVEMELRNDWSRKEIQRLSDYSRALENVIHASSSSKARTEEIVKRNEARIKEYKQEIRKIKLLHFLSNVFYTIGLNTDALLFRNQAKALFKKWEHPPQIEEIPAELRLPPRPPEPTPAPMESPALSRVFSAALSKRPIEPQIAYLNFGFSDRAAQTENSAVLSSAELLVVLTTDPEKRNEAVLIVLGHYTKN